MIFARQTPSVATVRRSRCDYRTRAFTLFELLIAATITALLVGFIVLLVANISRFWTRSSGRLSAEAQARYILDQLTLDLQSSVYRDDGRVYLAADVLANTSNSGCWELPAGSSAKPVTAFGTGLRYDAAELGSATFGQAGTWLRFITTKRGSNTDGQNLSAPVAVGWQIIRRASTSGYANREPRYLLHRAEVTPARTLESGYDITAPAYTAGGINLSVGDPGTVRTPPIETVVGDNVIDFGVRFYARNTAGTLRRIFPSADETFHRASNPPGVAAPTTQFPEVIEVFVRILTEEGERLIAGFEADPQRVARASGYSSDAEYWWPLALAHSHGFTRRIVLPGKSP